MGCGTSSDLAENVILPSHDRYERRELIGVGHHGRVYKCFYHLEAKEYALKVIDQLQTMAAYKLTKQTWTELVNKLTQLKHYRITTYTQIQFNQREISVIMDIAKEGTLKKYVQKMGKMTEQITAILTERILQGLNYLHSEGVFHKDLKTNNILMFAGEQIKLTDYALAELYDSRLIDAVDKPAAGKKEIVFSRGDSLPYMAPQVIKNLGTSQKSDVWSLGCVVIEMLTGKTPWFGLGSTFQQAFKTVSVGAHPPFPPNISFECQNFLMSCLANNPNQRLTVKQLMNHDFIRTNSKKSKHVIEQIDSVKLKLQKTDGANRVQSRSKANKYQQIKSPMSIQKIAKNQNDNYTVAAKRAARRSDLKSSKNYKVSRESRIIDDKLLQLKQAVNSMGSLNNSKVQSISKQDILPQIVQEKQETIMLNNKQVKIDIAHKQNINKKIKTDQSNDLNSQPNHNHRQYRGSLQLQEIDSSHLKKINQRFRIKSRNNHSEQENGDPQDQHLHIDTQPAICYSQIQHNKQFFKRPLKLLKKKLRENKLSGFGNNVSTTQTNQSFTKVDLQKLYFQEKDIPKQSKIRSTTESSRQEKIINTSLARAERDRYINQQLLIRKQRQQDKLKWQQQLKQGAEIIKKQFSHRYAPSHEYLIASLQK